MADSDIDQVAQAIHDILKATTLFKSGTPHVQKELGAMPTFTVWWPGWESSEEAHPTNMPSIVTHEFQVDVFHIIGSNVGQSESRFRELVQESVKALKQTPRLNDTCIRSRVRRGANEIDGDRENPFFVSSIIVEVDRSTW